MLEIPVHLSIFGSSEECVGGLRLWKCAHRVVQSDLRGFEGAQAVRVHEQATLLRTAPEEMAQSRMPL